MPEPMPKTKRYPQQDLAERLRAAMQEANLSQADLARACGVKIQSVHGWREDGRIAKRHLWTICKLTGKSLEYFLLGLTRGVGAVVLALSLALHAPDSFDNNKIAPQLGSNTDCMPKLRAIWRKLLSLVKRLFSPPDSDARSAPAW